MLLIICISPNYPISQYKTVHGLLSQVHWYATTTQLYSKHIEAAAQYKSSQSLAQLSPRGWSSLAVNCDKFSKYESDSTTVTD